MSSKIFEQIRFEQDDMHVYYIPKWLRSQLESSRPVYLVGSRGTGKTTLLKALSWRERLTNRFLREQLSGKPFADHLIGAYIKLSRGHVIAVSEWLRDVPDELRTAINLAYFELMWAEAMSEAASVLLAEGVVPGEPTAEISRVKDIVEKWPQLKLAERAQDATIRSIYHAVRKHRSNIEFAAFAKTTSAADLLASLPFGGLGEFSLDVGRCLAGACDPSNSDRWFFKILIDEAEGLDSFQQVVLNTLVRHSERPVIPLVAFVRMPDDPTSTLNPRLPLQAADRDVVVLNDDFGIPEIRGMTDTQFKDLVEGIINARISATHPNRSLVFSTEGVLGSLDINGLLLKQLSESESDQSRKLLKTATVLQSHPFFARNKTGGSRRSKEAPPIYQTYLVEKRGLDLAKPSSPNWKRRKQDSAELRKGMVAAYLSLSREFGFRVKYASANMVLQMSDQCVRDFLRQLRQISRAVKKSLERFLASEVNADVQSKALIAASKAKRDILASELTKSPAQSNRLVDSLAHITAHLQCEGPEYGYRNLRSVERGRFCVESHGWQDSGEKMLELLKEAHEGGYLKMLEVDEKTWLFRVHCSLAAAYGFSYRGAEYRVNLSLEDLIQLGRDLPKEDRERFLSRICEKLAKASDDRSLDEEPTLFDPELPDDNI